MQKFTAILLSILVHIAALEAKLKAAGVKFRSVLVDAHMQSWADAEAKAEAKVDAVTEAYMEHLSNLYENIQKVKDDAAAVTAGKAAAAAKLGA